MAVEYSQIALKVFRQIITELRKSDKNFSRQSPQFKFLINQMKDHKVTQRIFSKAPNEMEHIANLYATYLTSTRRLCELEARYKGGEKSVEESARLVGLALPKRE